MMCQDVNTWASTGWFHPQPVHYGAKLSWYTMIAMSENTSRKKTKLLIVIVIDARFWHSSDKQKVLAKVAQHKPKNFLNQPNQNNKTK